MKKHLRYTLAGVAMLAVTSFASAQLGGLGGLVGGGNSGGASAESIVKKYAEGSQSVMYADSHMLEALGHKEQAEKLAVQAKNLTEGSTKDAFSDAAKLQTESSQMLEQDMASRKGKMDAESKKKFAQGLGELGKGVILYVGMTNDVKSFKPSATSIGGAGAAAVYVVKSLPDNIKSLASTLKSAMAFAKANDITVPKEASDATSML